MPLEHAGRTLQIDDAAIIHLVKNDEISIDIIRLHALPTQNKSRSSRNELQEQFMHCFSDPGDADSLRSLPADTNFGDITDVIISCIGMGRHIGIKPMQPSLDVTVVLHAQHDNNNCRNCGIAWMALRLFCVREHGKKKNRSLGA